MKDIIRLFSLSGLVWLAGCTMIPDYTRPELPVTPEWPGPVETADIDESLAAQLSWTEFFRSPALQTVVRTALEHNRDFRVATLRIEQARALYRIERSDLVPNLDIGGSARRSNSPEAASQSERMGRGITSAYNADVSVTAFELDLFGRLRSENRAALEEYFATEEARRALQISLIAETANVYLQWLADRKILALTEDTLAAQQKSYDLIKSSYDRGLASNLDVAQVRQAVEIARVERVRFARRVQQDRNALELLMGTHLPEVFSPEIHFDDMKVLEQLPVGLPSDVLLLRPDVLAAEHFLKADNARIGAARAAFFPRLTLTGSYGFASSDLDDLFSSAASDAWNFAPRLVMPIFQGGRNVANLDLAHALKNIAVAEYERTIQAAFREVADELAGRRTLDLELQAQRDLVQAAQESYDLSYARYRSGIDSFLAVLDAQRTLFAAQQQLIDVERQRISNLVNLYKALGGGIIPDPAAEAKPSA